eukprot:IDg3779t1
MVIMGHTDPEKGRVVNEAPTILRSSVRILLTIGAIFQFKVWSRDVTQAFLQSQEALGRLLFVILPSRPDLRPLIREIISTIPKSESNISKNEDEELALKVLQPWYGLSDSPGYWWQTYKRYHLNELGMSQCVLDPCLFFKKRERDLTGIIGTLVDDTLGVGTLEFANEEEEKSSMFDSKPRTTSFPFKFNGAIINKNGQSYTLSQKEYT